MSPPVTENSTKKPRVPLTRLPQERHPAEPQCETTTGHRAPAPRPLLLPFHAHTHRCPT